jgi:hypothetical protein
MSSLLRISEEEAFSQRFSHLTEKSQEIIDIGIKLLVEHC